MKQVNSDDLIEIFAEKQRKSNGIAIASRQQQMMNYPQQMMPQQQMNYPQQMMNYNRPSFVNRPGYDNDPNNPLIQTLLIKIKKVESEINNSLINEDIMEARNLYNEMKELFSQFPDNYYELKTDLFSDLLSANFRLHQLEIHLNKLKRIDINRIMYDEKRKELLREKEEEIRLEKSKVESEIANIGTDINKYNNNQINEDIIPSEYDKNDEIELLHKKAKLDRIKHDNEINKLNSKKELDDNINISEIMIVDSKKPNNKVLMNKDKQNIKIINEDQAKIFIKKLENKKEDLVNKLYSEGIKKLYSQDKLKAKTCFKKILEINPEYKPALIRLEQVKSHSKEAVTE